MATSMIAHDSAAFKTCCLALHWLCLGERLLCQHVVPIYMTFCFAQRAFLALQLLHRKSFEAGKVFGRRQTLWDAIVTVIAGQERNAMGLLLKVVFSALVNFTVGMVSSIFVFIFKLPWILVDYKAGWVRLWHKYTCRYHVSYSGAPVSFLTQFDFLIHHPGRLLCLWQLRFLTAAFAAHVACS